MQPNLSQIPEFYHKYVQLVTEENLSQAFEKHATQFTSFLQAIPTEKWDYCYAEDKWSIKEVVQHIIDAERIFGYRALTFARKDNVALPGFDENKYASNSNADDRAPKDLLEELELVQKS